METNGIQRKPMETWNIVPETVGLRWRLHASTVPLQRFARGQRVLKGQRFLFLWCWDAWHCRLHYWKRFNVMDFSLFSLFFDSVVFRWKKRSNLIWMFDDVWGSYAMLPLRGDPHPETGLCSPTDPEQLRIKAGNLRSSFLTGKIGWSSVAHQYPSVGLHFVAHLFIYIHWTDSDSFPMGDWKKERSSASGPIFCEVCNAAW